MSGRILEMAKAMSRRIVNDGGFSVELTITPTGLHSVNINGIATSHSQTFTPEGLPEIGENDHCIINELDLNDLGVVTRVNGVLKMKDWKVEWTDALEISRTFVIAEPFPDRTLGLIRIQLGKFE